LIAASLAVVLLVHGEDQAASCLEALPKNWGNGVALLAGGNAAGREALEKVAGKRAVVWLDADGPAAWNAAAELIPAGDLVLLDDASEVGPGWLAGLRDAAQSEPDAATFTALGNDAAFLSIPRRNEAWPLPPGLTPKRAAERVGANSLSLHPRIPTALPHAALIRRPALELVGGFDESLAPVDALADFSARCTAAGLAHVVADEVFVARREAVASPSLDQESDKNSALAHALLAASVTLEPLQVTVDARLLAWGINGSIVHAVELLGALDARNDTHVRALLPETLGDEAGRALGKMPSIERLSVAALDGPIARTHVAHRPWQAVSIDDMKLLDRLGERSVVTNQDLIGYRTPSTYASQQDWLDYRRVTREALAFAAMVLFLSKTAAADARSEELVPVERMRVVQLGAHSEYLTLEPDAKAPAGVGSDRPFLLVLGNRFKHKNVGFALELLATLATEHDWQGGLVIAGYDPPNGSSAEADSDWLRRHPRYSDRVHAIGPVTEAEKAWLLRAGAAVVYPSTYEGFGLVPFEAAAAGTPCLVAHVSSLRDTIGEELALLTPWDAEASAQRAIAVLTDEAARSALVAGIQSAGKALTWEATGDALFAAYHDAVRLPAPAASRLLDRLTPVGDRPKRALSSRSRRALRQLWRRGPAGG
jgi:glycosyltransferase involved in cell wall biosynthesis